MKPFSTLIAAALLSGVTAQAALFSSGTIDTTITDGNPTGIASTINTSGQGLNTVITGLRVTINVSGGYNGDLICYLSYGGTSVNLLNRIGSTGGNPFGSTSSGFTSFTFADSGSTGIRNLSGSGPLTSAGGTGGAYAPDSGGTTFGSAFSGVNPNGNWTLFFADMAGGGGTATLNSWSLDITAVPEPVNVALGILGGFGVVGAVGRGLWSRRNQRSS